MSAQNSFISTIRKRKGLLIIIIAALLLELLSVAQYYFTRHLLESELEKRAESELTLKAILIKSTLNASEDVLKDSLWKIQSHLEWLSDTINSRHTYPSSFAMLLTEEGKLVVPPPLDRINMETSASLVSMINDSTVMRKKSISGRSMKIHFRNGNDGRDGTVFYTHMKGQPYWLIAVVGYDDEVYAPLVRLRVWLTLLMLGAFGILLFVVARYARGEKKLQRKTLEQDRIEGELRIANDIQQALLPTDDELTLEDVSEVSIEGRLIPAKEVGGDLYNAFVRDGKLFFCIGDVSGKGIPSALIMAITQTLFRNIAARESNPAHIMEQLNMDACRNNKTNVFVTLFIGVLDLPTGHLRYCNAGHEVPLQDGEPIEATPNLPIGLFEDFKYEMQETMLKAGTTLFLYTDGLTEAKNAKRELFGRGHIVQMIKGYGTTNPKQLVDTVIKEVQQFTEGTQQSDDMTLLAISYTSVEEDYILDEQLKLKNDIQELTMLNAFVKDVMTRLNIDKPLTSKLRLALEEAVVNVMEYAYPAGSKGDINIRVTCDRQRLKFIIADSGISFNPTAVAVADTTLTAEERPVGGLGIFLVREMMDTVNYERTDGQNVLTLSKTIHKL